MKLRLALAGLAILVLNGCAVQQPALAPAQILFNDAAFKPPHTPVDPRRALELSPEMQKFADNVLVGELNRKGMKEGLIDAMYQRGKLQLDYDADRTRTAAEAFTARRGNCMSLVLMTAAFARYLEVPVRYNSVYVDESITRASGMFFVAGHVNITLTKPQHIGRLMYGDAEMLTVDFIPAQQMRGQRSRVIDERTLLAMYLNNRAAEELSDLNTDEAYWWARAAIETDDHWLAGYNTLAIVYRRKGLPERAEAALRQVLAREPLNTQALSNLVLVLKDAGRTVEAKVYADQLEKVQPVPPYQFFDQGIAAMKDGDYSAARSLFRKEVERAAYVSEFHFWLALANYGLGDMPTARSEIAKALENSTTTKDQQMYGAKLAWLNEQRRR